MRAGRGRHLAHQQPDRTGTRHDDHIPRLHTCVFEGVYAARQRLCQGASEFIYVLWQLVNIDRGNEYIL